MPAKKDNTTDNHEFAHAETPAAPEVPATRNLTQEHLQAFFEQKKEEASRMENPPKELLNLDPAKRAERMMQPG